MEFELCVFYYISRGKQSAFGKCTACRAEKKRQRVFCGKNQAAAKFVNVSKIQHLQPS